ncbi:MAG: 4'-phosphopantetheinyl transferase superfamily protein [Paracoccaceae bacterium]|nr:4'-phosphopantetheinyl transferase superfamily protein [Paracoccaceae bacterium]
MIQQIEDRIAALYHADVAVAVLPVAADHPPLLPVEEPAIARAVPGRRAEFTAGRAAARLAMQRLGLMPQAVPAAPDRSPIWPAGLTGSISHAAGFCAAVLAREAGQRLGLDIEDPAPLDTDLWPLVLTPDEIASLDLLPATARGLAAKRIFGIKEAAYKAQFPLTGAVIGFQALQVTLTDGGAAARVAATRIGQRVPGLAALFPASGTGCGLAGPDDRGGGLLIAAMTLPS